MEQEHAQSNNKVTHNTKKHRMCEASPVLSELGSCAHRGGGAGQLWVRLFFGSVQAKSHLS